MNERWGQIRENHTANIHTFLLFGCGMWEPSYGLAVNEPLGLVSSSKLRHAVNFWPMNVPLASKPWMRMIHSSASKWWMRKRKIDATNLPALGRWIRAISWMLLKLRCRQSIGRPQKSTPNAADLPITYNTNATLFTTNFIVVFLPSDPVLHFIQFTADSPERYDDVAGTLFAQTPRTF